MSIDQAQQHLRQGQYIEALNVLQTLPDSNDVQALRFQAASPLERPEALVAAKYLATQTLAPESHALLFNWAVQRQHSQLIVDLGKPQLAQRLNDWSFLLRMGQAAKDVRAHHLGLMCLHQALVVADGPTQRAAAYSLLGIMTKDYGQIGATVAHFGAAYRLSASADDLHNLIMTSQYAQSDITQYYDQAHEFRRFTDVQRVVHALDRLQPARLASGLRIGLISGDFISHSLTPLISEILGAIPQISPHVLYLYQNRPEKQEDPATIAYKKAAAGWTNITDMTADQVVVQMLYDQLDVLIDLAGHTAANRLDVLARRPAPVQIGWVCGMMSPCAVEAVPYFLADQGMLTPHIKATCPERLIELPSAYVYCPATSAPLNTTNPVDRLQAIQFGCLNNPCKVTPAVLDVWARILIAVPTSTLHLKTGGADSATMFQRELMQRGVSAKQFVSVGHQPSALDVQRYYTERIDIALDPWPCAGMLTTLEAWWMGVPTITLVGQTFLHNQSASVLQQLGAVDLICGSIDQYIQRALRLAADRPRLRALRTNCRTTMDSSLIRQPRIVAQHVINGIEACWTDWCTSRHQLATKLA